MNSFKNITIIILIATVIFLALTRKTEIDTKPFEKKIDSLELLNSDLKLSMANELKKVEKIEKSEDHHKSLADSLSIEIKKPHTCPEVVELQEKQISALESSLERCKESKSVYRVTIQKCQELVANTEMIIVTDKELDKANYKLHSQEKKKSFFKGMATGGAITIVLVLLLI